MLKTNGRIIKDQMNTVVNTNKTFVSENMQEFMDPISNNSFDFPIYIINLDRKVERYTYVRNQLDKMKITNYRRVSAIDGFKLTTDKLLSFGLTSELAERKGLAGCAASHIKVWKHIAENKLGWTLILEDDAHFHPDFMKIFSEYWKHCPKNAKIIFPGFSTDASVENSNKMIIEKSVMCTHAYMLRWQGAQELLDNLLPISQPVDIALDNYLKDKGCFIFNGNISIDGLRPNNYKEANGRRCMFNGIVYQNHEEQGSTIHGIETVY